MSPRSFWLIPLLVCASSAAAQDAPIKRARISLAPGTAAVERITIENLRQSPLVAFQIGLFAPGATTPSSTYFADYTFDGVPAARGPIAPRERRNIDVDVSSGSDATSVVMMLAQFADGHCEGHAPAEDSGLRLRMPCPKPSGTVTSVGVSSQRTSKADSVVVVENLATVPIEAFGFEIVGPRSTGGAARTIDYCTAPPGTPAPHGRIGAGETRELSKGQAGAPGAGTELRLTFVLFEDLGFEGSAALRDELFRNRELQAAGYAFAMEALREAAALPVSDAVTLLERKRSERALELRAQGRRDDVDLLYDAIAEAKHAPGTFAPFLKGLLEFADEQRRLLLRHRRTTAGTAAR